MGCILGTEHEKQDKTVAKDLQHDKTIDSNIKKLLFLGSGGSGKSTLFKQLRTIHGQGFEDKDRLGFKDHIFSQIIDQVKAMIESIDELRSEDAEQWGHLQLTPNGEKAAELMHNARNDVDVDEVVAANVEILWKEPAIREIYENRAHLKIDDSTAYFFDEVRRIATKSYIPTDKDILLVRHRTTGVVEQKFEIRGTTFHIFDVGGQKSERKKWIHCFEHVTAVIFVTALSSYNEVLFEDDSINAMQDSLSLFEEICNLRWFSTTAMILFLNKKDVFAEKLQKFPLSVCFPDYEGSAEYDACVDFIRHEYESKNQNPRDKSIYSHVTCATDKSNVEKVFGDVQHIVISDSLQRGGLI